MKIYQCKYYKFDNDDLSGCGGKWCFCYSPYMHRTECFKMNSIYSQKYCCGYERGELRGEREVADWEREEGHLIKERSNEHIEKLRVCWE